MSLSFKVNLSSTHFAPRRGLLRRNAIEIQTPGVLATTSRGVVPHLSRDHAANIPAIQVPFESFLEQTPPIPTLAPGPHPLHSFLGFDPATQLVFLTLRDPHDPRILPFNTDSYVTTSTGRGVRRVSPNEWTTYARACAADVVVALPDIPSTSPPFSQKRVERSLSRTASWLAKLLAPVTASETLNVVVHLAGGVNIQARRAFASNLTETLYDTDVLRPYRCLDDGVVGYIADLVPLRATIAAAPNKAPSPVELLKASLVSLPGHKLRLVNSVTSPHEMLRFIRDVGVDLFDTKWAQDAAAVGVALDFVFPPPPLSGSSPRPLGHNLYRSEYATDFSRLSTPCSCAACCPTSPATAISHSSFDTYTPTPDPTFFSRAYIHHLLHTHEMAAHSLLVLHNTAVVQSLCAGVRQSLETDVEGFRALVDAFEAAYDDGEVTIREATEVWREVDLARGKGRFARDKQ